MAAITVIGIDPGSRNMGWGIVRETSGVLEFVDCGVVRPNAKLEFAERLSILFHDLHAIIARHKPQEAAVEQVFTAKNAATALKLGQARGVAVAACAAHGLMVRDYQPTEIKKALVGVGRAEKEQVAFMVGRFLNIKQQGLALDATDALAVAICHLSVRRLARLTAQAHK